MPPISDEQKQKIITAVITAFVTLILSVLAILGYNVYVVQPVQTAQSAAIHQTRVELGLEDPFPGEVTAESLNGGGWLCKAGSKACVDSRYGRDLVGYSDNGSTEKWKIEGTDGTFSHSGFDIRVAGTTISPTNGATITPTASLQPLSSAGDITSTLSVTDTAGAEYTNNTVVVLYNTTNHAILFADSGNLNASTAITLGQYDVLAVRYDHASRTWVELYTSNN